MDDLLEITWNPSGVDKSSLADQMMVLLYDTANSKTLTNIFDGPFRSAGTHSISIPAGMQGGEAELYIAFVAADRSAQSDSQYLGRWEV